MKLIMRKSVGIDYCSTKEVVEITRYDVLFFNKQFGIDYLENTTKGLNEVKDAAMKLLSMIISESNNQTINLQIGCNKLLEQSFVEYEIKEDK